MIDLIARSKLYTHADAIWLAFLLRSVEVVVFISDTGTCADIAGDEVSVSYRYHAVGTQSVIGEVHAMLIVVAGYDTQPEGTGDPIGEHRCAGAFQIVVRILVSDR
jgi:hypothetical protein